jgi:hypothetical protein
MKGSETYGKGLSKNPTMIFIFGYLKLSELSGDWFISTVPWTGWYFWISQGALKVQPSELLGFGYILFPRPE